MKHTDDFWLREAYSLSKKCTQTSSAFCVGAIIINQHGNQIAKGYSRETEEGKHAEEIAIEKAISEKKELIGATLYSSLEPCGERLSGRKTCVARIIESGITRVVFGAYEPSTYVKGEGEEFLKKAGVETRFVEIM